MENQTYEEIAKEVIPGLKFSPTDVLTDGQARKKRIRDISRATVLGNGYHGKVEIFFETADGDPKRVATTIWDHDEKYIILKSGASIPIKSVYGIEFF
jgi:hypothetical protein